MNNLPSKIIKARKIWAIQLNNTDHLQWSDLNAYEKLTFIWDDVRIGNKTKREDITIAVSQKNPKYSFDKVKNISTSIQNFSSIKKGDAILGVVGTTSVNKIGIVTQKDPFNFIYNMTVTIKWVEEFKPIKGYRPIFKKELDIEKVTPKILEHLSLPIEYLKTEREGYLKPEPEEYLQTVVENIENRLFRNYEKDDDSIGVQTIYLQYKVLEVSDVSKLLHSYYQLYKLLYKTNFSASDNLNDIEMKFKSSPEDILQFLSVHTGNSITFKSKTGWTPSFDLKDGYFEIAIPKGYTTLLVVGYILQNIVTFGITNYKDLLEIEHTKLGNEKLQYEVNELKNKCQKQDKETERAIQTEIHNFYNVTINNNNITRIEINQNTDGQKKNIR